MAKNDFAFGIEVKYSSPGKVSLYCHTWQKRKSIEFSAEFSQSIDVATAYFKSFGIEPQYHTEHKNFIVFVFDRKDKRNLARAMNYNL